MIIMNWGRIALAAALAVGGASGASAYEPIERSGNTYHQAVCARGNPHGEARCFAHVVVDARGNEIDGKPNASPLVVPSGFGPADLRSAYNVAAGGSASTLIAIVDAYGYSGAESDLGVYRSQYGIAACTTANGCFKKVNQNGVAGSYPANNTGWDQEAALDLDMASAMCSGCHIVLVEANSASLADLAAAVNTAANMGARVISNSYGGSETGSATYAAAYNHGGVAITASSGDSGYGVSFPASANTVIAVGGTNLTRSGNSRGWSEVAWTSAGSGCSSIHAKPSWQKDTLCGFRMEADISAVADPNTGVAVYGPTSRRASGWLVFGGTSVAAPLVGGMYGLKGAVVTNSASSIYAAPAGSLNDVTSGSNGSCGGTYFCTAGVGYDGPTGLGTPNGTNAL
jgi:hypothetical protein